MQCALASFNVQFIALLQELRTLQTQLERSQLDKLRAVRARDGVAAKLGRMLQAGNATLRSSLQSLDNATNQTPGHSPAALTGYAEGAFSAAATAEQQPCSRSLFGSPPRSPASARGPAAEPAAAAAMSPTPKAAAAASGAVSASPRGGAIAAASSSPRNGVSNSSSSNRGSPSAREGRVGGLPGRAAASAPCSPHGKALGLSIATHVAERRGKDQ
jgi:hypothetical protein